MCIDILLATYNGARFISEQIDSIIAQSYTNWRLLISDDGSKDGTLDIINRYAQRDKRIKIVESRNTLSGAAGNFFGLLSYVESPYAMFCDQDDVWDKDKITKTIDEMYTLEKKYNVSTPLLVYTDSRIVDWQLDELSPSLVSTLYWNPNTITLIQAVCGNVAQGATVMMNRRLVKCVANNYPNYLHDWWVFTVALALGQVGYIEQATMSYRQHDNNVIGANSASFFSWIKHFFDNPSVLKNAFSQAKQVHKRIAERAELVLQYVGYALTQEDREAILFLATISKQNRLDRICLYKKYNLLGSAPIREKIYKTIGLLFI